jgi:proteasomal ATPase-associated factor 1
MRGYPRVSVQPTALDVIRDVRAGHVGRESFWVAWNNVDADILAYKVQEQLELRSMGVISVQLQGSKKLLCSYNDETAIVRFPKHFREYTNGTDITTVDVSPQGELLLVGTSQGDLDVLSVAEVGQVRRSLDGHLLHTTKAKFFPSGQVAVSAGSDYQIKIWSVIDGSNPRTLTGHKGQINDLAIIGRGRNIVSGCEDGTVKLWECGSGAVISTLKAASSVRSLCVTNDISTDPSSSAEPPEYETEGKVVVAACRDEVVAWDVRTKSAIFTIASKGNNRVVSCDGFTVLGTESGELSVWDARHTNACVSTIRVADGEISDLSLYDGRMVVVSQGNEPVTAAFADVCCGSTKVEYLSGEEQPALAVAQGRAGAFVAGKNGSLRSYGLVN